MTTTESRASAAKPTPLQVAAAKLVITADRKLGDQTPDWIERVAQGRPPKR